MGVFDETFRSIKKKIDKLKKDSIDDNFKQELGEMAQDLLYKRVKSGYGVDDDQIVAPNKKKLEPLSPTTILQRKGKIAFFTNKQGDVYPYFGERKEGKSGRKLKKRLPIELPYAPGPGFSPSRSNLTASGQMLESIELKVGKNIVLEIPNSKRKDKNTNAEIAKFNAQGDRERNRPPRPFFALTVAELRVLFNHLKKQLEDRARELGLGKK